MDHQGTTPGRVGAELTDSTNESNHGDGRDHLIEACAEVARQRVEHAVLTMTGTVPLSCIELASINNFVFELEVSNQLIVAKHSFLGMAKSSLFRRLRQDGISAVLRDQATYLQHETTIDREAAHLRVLDYLKPGLAPSLTGVVGGVLAEEKVFGTPLLVDALASNHPSYPDLLMVVIDEVQHLWAVGPDAIPSAYRSTVAEVSNICPSRVFKRKFMQASTADYITSLDLGSTAETQVRHVAGWLADQMVAFEDRVERKQLIYGDLKPEHFLFDGSRWRLIDPSLHISVPAIDVARLVGRSALVLLSHGVTAVEPLAAVAHRAELAFPDDAWRFLGDLALADLLNILSAYLALDEQTGSTIPEPIHAAYAQANELMSALVEGPVAGGSISDLISGWATSLSRQGGA